MMQFALAQMNIGTVHDDRDPEGRSRLLLAFAAMAHIERAGFAGHVIANRAALAATGLHDPMRRDGHNASLYRRYGAGLSLRLVTSISLAHGRTKRATQ